MATEKQDSESNEQWFSGWRKVIVWGLGAGVLALVGYRGALGTSVTDVAAGPSLSVPAPRMSSTATPVEREPPAPAASAAAAAVSSSAKAAVAQPGIATPATAMPAAEPAAAAARGGEANAPPSAAITADGKIVLNLATEDELRRLPGIGKARAQAIIEQRTRAGRFRRLEELLRVKGIGRKRLTLLRPKVVLDPP